MTVPMPDLPEVAVFGARGTHDDVTAVTDRHVVSGVDADREEPVDDEEHDRG